MGTGGLLALLVSLRPPRSTRLITPHCVQRPENILLKSEAEFTILKLTDFNLSTIVGPESYRQTFCGTLDYQAPETFTRQDRVSCQGAIQRVAFGVGGAAVVRRCSGAVVQWCGGAVVRWWRGDRRIARCLEWFPAGSLLLSVMR